MQCSPKQFIKSKVGHLCIDIESSELIILKSAILSEIDNLCINKENKYKDPKNYDVLSLQGQNLYTFIK